MRSEKAIGVAGSFPDRPAYRIKKKYRGININPAVSIIIYSVVYL